MPRVSVITVVHREPDPRCCTTASCAARLRNRKPCWTPANGLYKEDGRIPDRGEMGQVQRLLRIRVSFRSVEDACIVLQSRNDAASAARRAVVRLIDATDGVHRVAVPSEAERRGSAGMPEKDSRRRTRAVRIGTSFYGQTSCASGASSCFCLVELLPRPERMEHAAGVMKAVVRQATSPDRKVSDGEAVGPLTFVSYRILQVVGTAGPGRDTQNGDCCSRDNLVVDGGLLAILFKQQDKFKVVRRPQLRGSAAIHRSIPIVRTYP